MNTLRSIGGAARVKPHLEITAMAELDVNDVINAAGAVRKYPHNFPHC